MRKLALLAAASFAAIAATPAVAQVATYSLSVDGSSSGLGAGPYGTVTVTQNAIGTLTFVETLFAGYRFHRGNDNHDAAAFSLMGDPNLTITGLTAGFTAENLASGTGNGLSDSEPPFGEFLTSIVCSGCGPGYGGGLNGPLTFTVGRTDMTALTLASLGYNVFNGQNIYFTSDLVIANGNTGNVGATLVNTPPVPEPATWAMMLVGFGATGVAMRRRRRKTTIAQFA
jgi:hypothetical protein